MLFNSFAFALFFPIVTLGYFLLPHRHRWWWLLGASCVFYMFFKAVYILILFFTIVIDYYAGLLIEKAQGRQRKWFLVMSLVANVGVLAVFKYYNFLNDNISGLYSLLNLGTNPIPALTILLPIGLSFHTFQAMSYTIEVYRGREKAERHFGIYSLYVMFYPQLVAGPIERPQNVLHQFWEEHKGCN
jgi:alginate O-acetyltransferase complex protein AlgI